MSLTMRLMKAAMFKVSRSRHDFERTVELVRENALRVGWDIPWCFELQQHYREKGLSDMTKVVNMYLCNPQGGYDIMTLLSKIIRYHPEFPAVAWGNRA